MSQEPLKLNVLVVSENFKWIQALVGLSFAAAEDVDCLTPEASVQLCHFSIYFPLKASRWVAS